MTALEFIKAERKEAIKHLAILRTQYTVLDMATVRAYEAQLAEVSELDTQYLQMLRASR